MTSRFSYKNMKRVAFVRIFFGTLIIFTFLLAIDGGSSAHAVDRAKYVIVMIADGWSANDIEATKKYCQATLSCPATPPYDQWTKYFMSTYYGGTGCGYDPNQAWSNFNYVKTGCITNSAAAATAMWTGSKTQNGRISVSSGGSRLVTIEERARTFGMASGAISTVELSDATPGAWVAHNDTRDNTYAIADEGFFGDPNTTGTPSTPQYGGGHGPTLPTADVIIGDGRPTYVSDAITTKLRTESGQAGKHYLVERQSGQNGGNNLIAASNDPNVTKLAGLFDQTYRLADGSGYTLENPTLSESSTAALNVLNKNTNGFVLMIEGGAVDWGGHAMNLNYAVGEMIDFNDAVQTVINWIENPSNGSNWNNTLLIVTGDHETGYLTAGPGVFPNQPLGTVNDSTIALEKININTGFRASWNDQNGNSRIDTGETVYWSWNTSSHTNSLIPFYTKGVGSGLFATYATNNDPVRGPYIDETNVFSVMNSVLSDFGAPVSVITAPVHGAILSNASPNPYPISGTATDYVAVQGIEVSTNGGSTWNAAACSGCPGKNVTWTYSWSLPADGSYTIKSRATDTSGNAEAPAAGNTVTVNRTGPSVVSTVPANGATGVALNNDVTINFSENMDCTTVTTSTVTISPAAGWTRNSCSGTQAVFRPSGQAFNTSYSITVTTGVKDIAGNPMAASNIFSYTTMTCSGSLSITPGQTLYGNPVDLTSIVTANNAVNLNYTVNGGCPAQSNASIIARRDTWKYNGANNGNIGTTWKNTAYDHVFS
jgi:alkaline phosphatase